MLSVFPQGFSNREVFTVKNPLAVTVLLVSSALPQTHTAEKQSASTQKKCATLSACRAEIQRLTDLLQAHDNQGSKYQLHN